MQKVLIELRNIVQKTLAGFELIFIHLPKDCVVWDGPMSSIQKILEKAKQPRFNLDHALPAQSARKNNAIVAGRASGLFILVSITILGYLPFLDDSQGCDNERNDHSQ